MRTKGVISFFISFILLNSALCGGDAKADELKRVQSISFEQQNSLDLIVSQISMTMKNFDGICRADLMDSFGVLNFIKTFMNLENDPYKMPQIVVEDLIEKLDSYLLTVKNFEKRISNELENLKSYSRYYMSTKFKYIQELAYSRSNNLLAPTTEESSKQESVLSSYPEYYTEESNSSEVTEIERKKSHVILRLKTTPMTLTYMIEARAQLQSTFRRSNDVRTSIVAGNNFPFLSNLEDTLLKVLVAYSMDPKSEDAAFLIDFFNVFGGLLTNEEFDDLIFTFINSKKLPAENRITSGQYRRKPDFFKNQALFEKGENSAYSPAFNIDSLFFKRHQDFNNIEKVNDAREKEIPLHPHWLKFFRPEEKFEESNFAKAINIGNSDPLALYKQGHKLIYLFYIFEKTQSPHQYKENANETEEEQIKRIASTLHYKLLDYQCFRIEKNTCSLAALIDREDFAKNFDIMLYILKPYTKDPEHITKDEVKQIHAINLATFKTFDTPNLPIINAIDPGFAETEREVRTDVFATDLNDLVNAEIDNKVKKLNEASEAQEQDLPSTHDSPLIEEDKISKLISTTAEEAEKVKELAAKIGESLAKIFPTLAAPVTPENVKTKVDELATINNNIDRANPAVKFAADKLIGENLKQIKDFINNPQNEKVPIETEKTFKGLQTKVGDAVIKDILEKTGASKSYGFMEYLRTSLADTFAKQNLEEDPNLHSEQGHYQTLRNLDIFVFYYMAQKEEAKDMSMIEQGIRNKYPNFDFNFHANVDYLIANRRSLIFMGNFIRLFESHRTPGSVHRERAYKLEHIQMFHKIYQLLCDIRHFSSEELAKTDVMRDYRGYVAGRLMHCTALTYQNALTDVHLYSSRFESNKSCRVFSNNNFRNELSTQSPSDDDIKKANLLHDRQYCRHGFYYYSEILPLMTTFLARRVKNLPFLTLFASKIILPDIQLIGSYKYFSFINDHLEAAKEGLQNSYAASLFTDFCNLKVDEATVDELNIKNNQNFFTEDFDMSKSFICSGLSRHKIIVNAFQETSKQFVEAFVKVAQNVNQYIDSDPVSKFDEARRVIIQIFETVTSLDQSAEGGLTSSYTDLGNFLTSSLFDLYRNQDMASFQQYVDPKGPHFKQIIADYLSLKFSGRHYSELNFNAEKIVMGVDHIFINSDLKELLIKENIVDFRNLNFLVRYANCPDNYVRIAEIIVSGRLERSIYTFTEKTSVHVPRFSQQIAQTPSNGDKAAIISAILLKSLLETHKAMTAPKKPIILENTQTKLLVNPADQLKEAHNEDTFKRNKRPIKKAPATNTPANKNSANKTPAVKTIVVETTAVEVIVANIKKNSMQFDESFSDGEEELIDSGIKNIDNDEIVGGIIKNAKKTAGNVFIHTNKNKASLEDQISMTSFIVDKIEKEEVEKRLLRRRVLL